ncbi:hypothetical protein [Halosimplex halobium]|uniref:hypothetical protein n=1 Tax=Halosimplex halobium TaxID=3396618 RepID=UPI003F5611DB
MTLKKVPNVDDVKKYNLAPKHKFYFGEDSSGSLYDHIVTNSSTNGTVNRFQGKGIELSSGDGTTDEHAGVVTGYNDPRPMRGGTGAKTLLQMFVGLGNDPENMTDKAEVGYINNLGNFDRDDTVSVQLGGGTNRFRVNKGSGTTETVQLSGSSFGAELDNPRQEFHISILIDWEVPESKLWINRQPLVDDPDATISERPNEDRAHGVTVYGDGGDGSETVTARYGEYAVWW